MKKYLVAALLMVRCIHAGESSLTVTFQPLDGLGAGGIHIIQVACHDWYSHSGQPTAIGLISAPNVPPTNNTEEAKKDLNLASACGLQFSCGDIGAAMDWMGKVITEFNAHDRTKVFFTPAE